MAKAKAEKVERPTMFDKVFKVKVMFVDEVLGTLPSDKEIYGTFIASNAPDAPTREQEIADLGVEAVEQKGITVFPKTEDGKPYIYDYQWKGFFKEAGRAMNRVKGTATSGIKAFLKIVDTNIFVEATKEFIDSKTEGLEGLQKRVKAKKYARQIVLNLPENGEMGKCQRPLRAQTMQGERVSLACSETVPAETTCEFVVFLMDGSWEKALKEWLDYAEYHGTMQWRNSGKGRFIYEIEEVTEQYQ